MQRLRDEYRQVGRKDGPTFQILAKELKGILQHEPEKLTEEEYQAALAAVVKRAKKRADGAEPLIIPDGKEASPKQD
jgi:hypothetical protein